MFYKVTTNSELVNTEPWLPGEIKTSACESLVPSFFNNDSTGNRVSCVRPSFTRGQQRYNRPAVSQHPFSLQGTPGLLTLRCTEQHFSTVLRATLNKKAPKRNKCGLKWTMERTLLRARDLRQEGGAAGEVHKDTICITLRTSSGYKSPQVPTLMNFGK